MLSAPLRRLKYDGAYARTRVRRRHLLGEFHPYKFQICNGFPPRRGAQPLPAKPARQRSNGTRACSQLSAIPSWGLGAKGGVV